MLQTPPDNSRTWSFPIETLWDVCFYLTLFSFFFSLRLIGSHLLHYSRPVIQRKIIAILWMVPIYATTSWLSLRYVAHCLYFDIFRDAYESIVLYMFFALCYGYVGQVDRDRVDTSRIYAVLARKGEVNHLPPFGRFLSNINLRDNQEDFLFRCKSNILQFVLVKPLASLIAILLHMRGLYTPGDFSLDSGYIYICIIVNISISTSLYWLVMFFLATREALVPYNPVPKFLCIKGVLFFSFWQSVIIVILHKVGLIQKIPISGYSQDEICATLQNALICVEMVVAAFAHSIAFPSKPYELLVRPGLSARRLLVNAIDLHDVVQDFHEISPLTSGGRVAQG